jgi:hypothetical protein
MPTRLVCAVTAVGHDLAGGAGPAIPAGMQFPVFSILSIVLLNATAGCVDGVEGIGDDEEDADLLIEGSRTATIRIVQHNIEKKQPVLEIAIKKANATDAHGITLQEVCPAQLDWLTANYGSRWTIASIKGKKARPDCMLPDGSPGYPSDVVIWRGGTDARVRSYDALGGPANAQGNQLICLSFDRAKVPVHLCSAHLISGDWVDPVTGTTYEGATVREQQATGIKQIANEWFDGAKNHFGIIAGDFNSQPGQSPLDKLYDGQLGGTGAFTEYNRSGGSRTGQVTSTAVSETGDTTARKIDYVFYSTNRAPLDGPAVEITPDDSDHDMLVSTVQMKK